MIWLYRVSANAGLEPRDNKNRAANRDRVFEQRNRQVRNLQRLHQPAASVVTRERANHAANRAQSDDMCLVVFGRNA